MLNYRLKRMIIFSSVFLLFYSNANALQATSFKWQIGEELTYKVSWGFIRLGTLHLSIEDTVKIDGTPTYFTKLKLDSNPWLFFVNMHSVFESYLTPDTYSRLFICEERNSFLRFGEL